MSKLVLIIRPISGTDDTEGTFGKVLVDGNALTLVSGELPWRDNQHGISCIPTGTYDCKLIDSPKHGYVYEIQNVPNRTNIEIHSYNFCGDVDLGKKSEALGCTAFGHSIGMLEGQMAVLDSRAAMKEFQDYMQGESFILTIINDRENSANLEGT